MEITFNVDSENEVVHVHVVPSASFVDDDQKQHVYKVDKICVDVTETFNCINEQSTHATCFDVSEQSEYETAFDYDIPFNEILCSDVKTEMLFLFVTECEYVRAGDIEEVTMGYAKYKVAYFWFYNPYEEHWVLFKDGNYSATFDSLEDVHTALQYDGVTQWTEETCTIFRIGDDALYLDATDVSDNYFNSTYKFEKDWNYNLKVITESDYNKYYDKVAKTIKIDCKTEGKPIIPWCYIQNIVLDSINITDTETCEASCADVNTMLAWYGFNLALNLNDMRKALYYWKLLKGLSDVKETQNCSCK